MLRRRCELILSRLQKIRATYDGLLSCLSELVSPRYSRTTHDKSHSIRCRSPSVKGNLADQAILQDLVGFACQGADLIMQTDLPVTPAVEGNVQRYSPRLMTGPYLPYSKPRSPSNHPVPGYPQTYESDNDNHDHLCYHHGSDAHHYPDHRRSPTIMKRYGELPPYTPRDQPTRLSGPKVFERRDDVIPAGLGGSSDTSLGLETYHFSGCISSIPPYHLSSSNRRTPAGGNLGPPPAKPAVRCLNCDKRETPEWRKGPYGPRTLCNACVSIPPIARDSSDRCSYPSMSMRVAQSSRVLSGRKSRKNEPRMPLPAQSRMRRQPYTIQRSIHKAATSHCKHRM